MQEPLTVLTPFKRRIRSVKLKPSYFLLY